MDAREAASEVASPLPSDLGIGEVDLHLFNEGTHRHVHDKLGAHIGRFGGVEGTRFAVWAPNASEVSVVGDFNGWDAGATPLRPLGTSGVWAGVVAGVGDAARYKYHLRSRETGQSFDKSDPVGAWHEQPPATASLVRGLDYTWHDAEWMAGRGPRNALSAPIAIYEVHLGSWRHMDGRPMGYRRLAVELARYVNKMGFTHVELMPVMEHPFDGSWGYQVTGYFAPTSRYGTPQDFMFFVDHLHQNGIGVILDWVPAHFPSDAHGLARFDGTHLFEHADPRKGFHPEWTSCIFNYGRHEVRSFLISSAMSWLDRYHVDGLRVDGVASMLYLDYAREEGEWIPNEQGGHENVDAIELIRQLNHAVYEEHPDVQMIAEESTAWPMVSRPVHVGGLGFGMKWDMGWMHDRLKYFARDPVHRKHHHQELTFRGLYAWDENFVLPLSHDEVVHGKGSLLSKMAGDDWQRFASLRLLLSLMYAEPGKKLLFMGAEIGAWHEWSHERSLDWHLCDHAPHRGIQRLVEDLNRLYRREPALHALDADPRGFTWLEAGDHDQSVLAFARTAAADEPQVVAVCNFTPVPREGYRIGVDRAGDWIELFNSDATLYGGSGMGNLGQAPTEPIASHGRAQSLSLVLPPLAAVLLRPAAGGGAA